ncbi:adenylyl-sulfate kinase [Micromonospora halophytica]|uniref:Adenylylsulphate kinase n=1 Tax=Micromonospora halophytica TaxID=47864 RepID=A0A1C5JFQ8_9ACTN|nr:adenylyl-sulfate kinase [Micromonospora halophytica]SCG69395.1 Adenylylsulphate kinase [Micromonospora halophytica]
MRRIGYVAGLLAEHGVTVLVPVIAPYAKTRTLVRDLHAAGGVRYVEVHVATPVEVCADRNVKRLYARQAAGELTGLTGAVDPYEVPVNPDLRVDTQHQTVNHCVRQVWALLTARGLS